MMGGYGMGMGGDWGGMLGLGMGFGWIIPLLVIGLVVWAIVAFTRSRAGSGMGQPALAILKERYAKGELDSKAYQKMRAELEK